MELPALPERCCSVQKNAGMAIGSKPADARKPIPTRSASDSLLRVKLIWFWIASPWAAVMVPSKASPGMPVVAPMRMAARTAAAEAMLLRPAFWMERAMCRWVTWAISCARTPASSLSDTVAVTRPALTPIKPPGSAKALIPESLTTKKLKRCPPS